MKKSVIKAVSMLTALAVLSACEIRQTESGYIDAFPALKTTVLTEITTTAASTAETTTAATVPVTSETTTTEITTTPPPEPVFVQADTQRFSQCLEKIYEDYDITGMSVALFSGGEIIHTENLGYADVENELLCSDNTRYRIASPSKLVSTMVLMKLCEEGRLSLDTVLSEATGIEYDSPYCTEKVQLKHLLTHTAGIFDTWKFENEPNMKYDINRLMVNSLSAHEPGTVFCYSNFGSGSIGAVVERISGEYFHDYAEKVLFEPLGMDAGYVIDLIDDKESTANIYDLDGEILKVKSWGRDAEYYESFGLGNSYYAAQCELIITASDLARLGIVLAGDGTVDGKRVLSEETVNAMNQSYITTDSFDMGLNVRIYDYLVDGRILRGHPGTALGCVTGLFYDTSDGTGIAFLTNRCVPYTDDSGFYCALREAVEEAYYCFFRYEEPFEFIAEEIYTAEQLSMLSKTQLSNIQDLNFIAEKQENMEFLAQLKGLNRLELWLSNELDVSALGELANLTEISIFSERSSWFYQNNLEALARLNKLEKIYIGNVKNQIDLSFFRSLSSLEFLSVQGTGKIYFSRNDSFELLKNLTVSECDFDLSEMPSMPNLTTLRIINCGIEDESSLSEIEKLDKLT
ncbi:MAG: serine hydrolase, partial [Ruminiclostridium sp.]|nr:serine hydrolase [Ruminiclostridium sp.]